MNKKIPDNFPFALSGRAVPLDFNLPRNRYPLPIACCSDTTDVQVWFYEYRGLHWYSVSVDSRCTFNSVPFLEIGNCISAFREFLRGYDFRFVDTSLANCRLSEIRRRPSPKSSEV